MTWEEVRADIENLLKDKQPDDVLAYIDANVTDLATAKAFLKKLALIALFMLYNSDYDFGAG